MIVLDGGMGRELQRMGAPFRQPEWSALALIEDASFVRKAHDRFIEAGADVITTNAYAVVPFHLGEERFAEDGSRLARLAARIAREAADASGRAVKVAGSVPPLFGSYRSDLFDPVRAIQLWPEIIEPQIDYVDFFLTESLSCIAESLMALELCAATGKPVWLSVTLSDEDPVLRSGETIADWIAALRASPRAGSIEAILFNCSQPEVMAGAVHAAAAAIIGTDWKIGVYANAFPKQQEEAQANARLMEIRKDLTPDRYAEFSNAWKAEGAQIIGGCCGIGPEHIAALRSA